MHTVCFGICITVSGHDSIHTQCVHQIFSSVGRSAANINLKVHATSFTPDIDLNSVDEEKDGE